MLGCPDGNGHDQALTWNMSTVGAKMVDACQIQLYFDLHPLWLSLSIRIPGLTAKDPFNLARESKKFSGDA
jgi:hypothetical protein